MWKHLLALVLGWSTIARAELPERLTDRGRLMPSGAIGGYWSNNEESPGLTRYASRAVWVEPSLTYFVRDRVGLGIYAGYSSQLDRTKLWDARASGVSAGARFVGELPRSDRGSASS